MKEKLESLLRSSEFNMLHQDRNIRHLGGSSLESGHWSRVWFLGDTGMLQIYSSRQSFFQGKKLHQADCYMWWKIVISQHHLYPGILAHFVLTRLRFAKKNMWFWVLKLTRVLLSLCGFTSCEASLHHLSLSTIIQRGLNSRHLGHLKTSRSLNLFWNKLWICCNFHHCEGEAY